MVDSVRKVQEAVAAEESSRHWLLRAGVVTGIAIAIAGGFVWRAKHRPATGPKFVTAAVAVGDVTQKVQATGSVQPLLQVNVGAQVNGRVTRVLVDFNSVVAKGDVLAEIDSSIYGMQVSAQQSFVLAQQAELAQARARADSAKAQMDAARLAFERVKRLHDQNLASKGDLDLARGEFDSAKATHDAAVAAIAIAEATVGAHRAQLNQVKANFGYTKLYAPVDGIVVTRNIDPGATVVASFQAPVLFVIAQDLKKMRILADIDEADVGKLADGMEADAVVDAFPGKHFHGVVQQVRYSPTTTQGVVTYSAVIEVANPEEKLRPGMTATITIKSREAKGVRRVPNAALRYKPAGGESEPALAEGKGRVCLLVSDKPGEETCEPKIVSVGITDGTNTELTGDEIAAGAKLVTEDVPAEGGSSWKLF